MAMVIQPCRGDRILHKKGPLSGMAECDYIFGINTLNGDLYFKNQNCIWEKIHTLWEVTVATLASRDNYNVTRLPLYIYVEDQGDGTWALYKALTLGTNATYVKITDEAGGGGTLTAVQIKILYESNPNTNAFTDALLTQLLATVPETRTITINSNTQDLSANRSWTLTTTEITEAGNLYFTNGRAITALTGANISIFNNDSGYINSLGSIGATPNLNGASISSGILTLQPASASFGGVVTTTSQEFAGIKTFKNDVIIEQLGGIGTRMVVADSTGELGVQAIPTVTPAGSNTEIQFNNAGAFAASNLLAWSIADSRLLLGNPSVLQVNAAETFVTTGDIRTIGGGINFTLNSTAFNGFKSVGAGHGINIWTVGSHIANFGSNGGSSSNGWLRITGNYNANVSTGTMRGLLINGSITPVGLTSTGTNLIELSPTIKQIGSDPINHQGTGPIRAFYYNPTIDSLNGSTHEAFRNTSGDIIHGNLAGVGNRMVVAEADGKLNVQAIPTGPTLTSQLTNDSGFITGTNIPDAVYSETLVWTGTAPTGATNHRYEFSSHAKRGFFDLRLSFENDGSGLTGVVIPLPVAVTVPKLLTGVTMTAGNPLYTGTSLAWRNSLAQTTVTRTLLKVNAAGTGYEIDLTFGSATLSHIIVRISYPIA